MEVNANQKVTIHLTLSLEEAEALTTLLNAAAVAAIPGVPSYDPLTRILNTVQGSNWNKCPAYTVLFKNRNKDRHTLGYEWAVAVDKHRQSGGMSY